jgi:hypothetical protein
LRAGFWARTQHKQAVSRTQHKQAVSRTQHKQAVSRTQHKQAVSCTRHKQAVSCTQHKQAVSCTRHKQAVSCTRHKQAVRCFDVSGPHTVVDARCARMRTAHVRWCAPPTLADSTKLASWVMPSTACASPGCAGLVSVKLRGWAGSTHASM